MKPLQRGFTLVELIVVIVILGILAATALPRFINVTQDARLAAVNGIAGGLRSAASVAQAKWNAAGGTGGNISMVGTTNNVTVSATTGIPTNATTGILRAMGCETAVPEICQGNTVAGLGGATSTWTPPGGNATCLATYDPAGTVTTTTGGC